MSEAPENYSLFEVVRGGGLALLPPYATPATVMDVGSRLGLRVDGFHFVMRNQDGAALAVSMLPPNLSALVVASGADETPVFVGGGASGVASPSGGGRWRSAVGKLTSGLRRKSTSGGERPAPPSPVVRAPVGRFFGRPFFEVIDGDALPQWLQDLLSRLHAEGCSCHGLFRKSANARVMREVRASLEQGGDVRWGEITPLVAGAVLKDSLRSAPDSLLPIALYSRLVKTLYVDEVSRVEAVQAILIPELPPAHLTLLCALLPLLMRICASHEETSMTPRNIGVRPPPQRRPARPSNAPPPRCG